MKRSRKSKIDAAAIAQKAWQKGERQETKRVGHRLTKMGLGEELPPLPDAEPTTAQKEAARDPLDILIEKKGNKTLAQMEVDDLLDEKGLH